MPDPKDETNEMLSLPPGEITPDALLRAVLPLVVESATQSASAATKAAEQSRSMEQALEQFKAAIDRNTEAAKQCSAAKQRENELLAERNELMKKDGENKANKDRQWHDTLRSFLTSPVMLQILQLFVIIGAALGFWTQMPSQNDMHVPTKPNAEATVPVDPADPHAVYPGP